MKRLLQRLFLGLTLTFGLAGCVTTTEPVEPLEKSQLLVSRAGREAVLQFDSEIGTTYQILYASDRKSPWRILPAGQHIVGNGAQIRLVDEVPIRENRRYRLRVKTITR